MPHTLKQAPGRRFAFHALGMFFQEQSYVVWGEAFWGLRVWDQTPPHHHLNQCFPL